MNYRKDKKKIIRELLHESDKELTTNSLPSFWKQA